MKAKEVLNLLNISRVTLHKYVKLGKIKVKKLNNGYYDYDINSVYSLLSVDVRINVIYARVSTHKQKNDLNSQILSIQNFCYSNNITFDKVFSDIASGISLDRPSLKNLLDDIFNFKIKNVYISYKDRLTRLSFSMLEFIFNKFGTKIIIINDSSNEDTDNEIFNDLITLIHSLSTKIYSKRNKHKFSILHQDLTLYTE